VTTPAERRRDLALGILGILLFLVLWEIVGRLHLLGLSWPALSTVVEFMAAPSRWPLFGRALGATLSNLAIGYVCGFIAGLLFAILAHLVMQLRPGADRLATMIHAVPSIAVAPLIVVLASRQAMPPTLAALSTFFVLYVSTRSGLETTSPAHRDVMRSFGARRDRRLKYLDFPAALPAIASGAKLAAPTALIGIIIGEWFGAPRGLGVLVINAMQNFQIPLLWSAVLLAVITSIVLFVLLSWIERRVAEYFR